MSPIAVTFEQLLDALECVQDSVVIVGPDSRLIYANSAAGQLFKKPREAMTGMSLSELYPRPPTALFYQNYKKARGEGRPSRFREPVKIFGKWLDVTMQPGNGGVMISFNDASPAILNEEMRMVAFLLTEKLKDLAFIVRSGGQIFYANQETSRLLGYSPDELLDMNILDLDPGVDQKSIVEGWAQFRASGTVSFETRYRARGGSEVPVDVSVNYLKFHGSEYCCIAARDITVRKRTEDELKRSNLEKEMLLKEIHHRVKNNLQIISSLLSLQSAKLKNTDATSSFLESQNRIRSMALIHEKLYRSSDLTYVDFQEYVRTLVRSLRQSYCMDDRVQIDVDITGVSLDIDNAIPCGLIINELVSNCLKYAFKGREAGVIRVSMVRDGGRFLLSVADNGVGMPPDIDFRNTASLGLQLVVTLTEQLNGEIRQIIDGGTEYRISFAVAK